MRLSELMSRLSPTELTEIALLLFLGVFVAVSIRALRKSARAGHTEASTLPLADDADFGRGGVR